MKHVTLYFHLSVTSLVSFTTNILYQHCNVTIRSKCQNLRDLHYSHKHKLL